MKEEILEILIWARMNKEKRECVLFIGTQYRNLYTAVDTPAEAAWFTSEGLRMQPPAVPGTSVYRRSKWGRKPRGNDRQTVTTGALGPSIVSLNTNKSSSSSSSSSKKKNPSHYRRFS
jgi:hypothetical protein